MTGVFISISIFIADPKAAGLSAIFDKLEKRLAKRTEQHRWEIAELKQQNGVLLKESQTLKEDNSRLTDENIKQQQKINELESELRNKISEQDELIRGQGTIDLADALDQRCDNEQSESIIPNNQSNELAEMYDTFDDHQNCGLETSDSSGLEYHETETDAIRLTSTLEDAIFDDADITVDADVAKTPEKTLAGSDISADQMAYVPDIGAEIECIDDSSDANSISNLATAVSEAFESNFQNNSEANQRPLLDAIMESYNEYRFAKIERATETAPTQIEPILRVYYRCLLCPAKFTASKQLSEHQTVCQNKINSNRPSSSIATVQRTINSQLLVVMNRKFVCTFPGCNVKYHDSKRSLIKHIQIHKNEFRNNQKFSCAYPSCNATFTVKDAYDAHISSHTNKKQFQCQYPGCNKKFWFESILIAHAKFHVGYFLFKCTAAGCEKKFNNKWHFVRHQQTHIIGENDPVLILN